MMGGGALVNTMDTGETTKGGKGNDTATPQSSAQFHRSFQAAKVRFILFATK